MEELEMELMARKDLAETEAKLEENSMLAEDFVWDSEWIARPCCLLVIISKS